MVAAPRMERACPNHPWDAGPFQHSPNSPGPNPMPVDCRVRCAPIVSDLGNFCRNVTFPVPADRECRSSVAWRGPWTSRFRSSGRGARPRTTGTPLATSIGKSPHRYPWVGRARHARTNISLPRASKGRSCLVHETRKTAAPRFRLNSRSSSKMFAASAEFRLAAVPATRSFSQQFVDSWANSTSGIRA
jgi:hypothetical protein